MTRHRGLTLALGLCALLGLTARESRAESIVMTLTWTSGTLTFDSTTPSPFILPGSSSTSLLVNTNAVNGFLSSNGSGITFSALGGSSNFPGSPANGTLSETGTAVLSGAGATSITVSETEGGFTSPTGMNGMLSSAQTAIFTNVAATGTETSNSSFNALTTAPLTSTSTGLALNQYSPGNSLPVGTVASGYSLDNTATINMTGSTPGPGTTTQFAVAATLTATTIPEPTSIIMMLTGMPLPLVVLGLLRRRRAAA